MTISKYPIKNILTLVILLVPAMTLVGQRADDFFEDTNGFFDGTQDFFNEADDFFDESDEDLLDQARENINRDEANGPGVITIVVTPHDPEREVEAAQEPEDRSISYIEDSEPYQPLTVEVVPGIGYGSTGGTSSIALGAVISTVGTVAGGQLAGVAATANRVYGVQYGGVFATSAEVDGIQGAGVFSTATGVNGAQLSGIFNSASGRVNGAQLAGVFNNADGDVVGAQLAGIFNTAGDVYGVQAAGIFNVAKKVNGVQLGLVNIADEMNGIALGLININKSGISERELYQDDMERIGINFLFGGRNLYFKAGARVHKDLFNDPEAYISADGANQWSWGGGVGYRINLGMLYGQFDIGISDYLVGSTVGEDKASSYGLTHNPVVTGRLSGGLKFFGPFGLIFGVQGAVNGEGQWTLPQWGRSSWTKALFSTPYDLHLSGFVGLTF